MIPPPPPKESINHNINIPIGNRELTTLPKVPGTENAAIPTKINANSVTTKKIK